ncbi:hypothetical protein Bca101_067046 [Brassica carinata]
MFVMGLIVFVWWAVSFDDVSGPVCNLDATRSSHRQCLIFWIKESFHLILKKAFRLIDDELEKILGLSSHRYLVQMAVTDNTDAAIFVASDGSITKLINVCASDVVLVWFATRPRTW